MLHSLTRSPCLRCRKFSHRLLPSKTLATPLVAKASYTYVLIYPFKSYRPLTLPLRRSSTASPSFSKMAFPNSYPHLNPVDTYREHLANLIGPIVGVEPALVYSKLQWTQTLD